MFTNLISLINKIISEHFYYTLGFKLLQQNQTYLDTTMVSVHYINTNLTTSECKFMCKSQKHILTVM